MTDETDAKNEAVQAVIDRVSSYQDGAIESTVEAEIRKGLDEAGVELTDEQVSAITAAIEERDGDVDAASVLGA